MEDCTNIYFLFISHKTIHTMNLKKLFSILKETHNKPCHKIFRKINNLKIYAFEKRFREKNCKKTCPKENSHTEIGTCLEFISTFFRRRFKKYHTLNNTRKINIVNSQH